MILFNQNIWGNMKKEESIANRNDLIRSVILREGADVCCFQECNPRTSRAPECDISDKLAPHYREAFSKNAYQNFTPVFYNAATMREIDSGWFLFDGKNDKNSKSVTWAILEERATRKQAAFLSVHFWWKWESDEDEEQRIANARQLAEFCNRLKEKYPIPFFISGDLNNGIGSNQGSRAYYEMLNCGMVDVRTVAAETTDLNTAHHYPVRNEQNVYEGADMPFKTLDYIFAYGNTSATLHSFRVLTDPDALNSSDHCPLTLALTL